MANNDNIFNGALTGTTAGIASRWITSNVSADYDAQRTLIAAFATEVDSQIAAGGYGQGAADLMESICAAVWRDRVITSQTDMEPIAGAIAALFTSVNAEVLPDGGGGSSTPFSNGLYVDEGTTTPGADQNGSAVSPYADFIEALTNVPDGGGILVAEWTQEAGFELEKSLWITSVVQQAPDSLFATLCPVRLGPVLIIGGVGQGILGLYGCSIDTFDGTAHSYNLYLRAGCQVGVVTSANSIDSQDSRIDSIETSSIIATRTRFIGNVLTILSDGTDSLLTDCVFATDGSVDITVGAGQPLRVNRATYLSLLQNTFTLLGGTTILVVDEFPTTQFYQNTLGGVTVATNADNNMHAIPSGNYAVSAPSTSWALTAAGCIGTYTGPDGARFEVTVNVGCKATVAATFAYLSGAVDHEGDVIGEASFSSLALGEMQVQDTPAPGGVNQRSTFSRIVTVDNGDTVQPAFGLGAASEAVDLELSTLTMTIKEVP